ncbi:Protein NYNRIN, partial [Mucuna pruriens]
MLFDGASNVLGHGIRAVLISLEDRCFLFTTRLGFNYTINIVEYEACVMGNTMALEYQVKTLKVYRNPALVVHQLRGDWETRDSKLIPYYSYVKELAECFEEAVPAYCQEIEEETDGKPWYYDIMCYMKNKEYPPGTTENNKRTLKRMAMGYFLNGDVEEVLEEIHEGIFGTHASGQAMARKILRFGYYWAKMEADCCDHVRKCHKYQGYVNNIQVPPAPLNILTIPWPFALWGIDVIGPIEPKESNGHHCILVVIDYFTKWVEAASYANLTRNVVVKFIKKDIICRYGTPSHITQIMGLT